MCIFVLYVGMFIMGILALSRGKIAVTPRTVVRGPIARIIGVILMLPFPLALGIGMLVGVGLVVKSGGVAPKEIPLWAALIDPIVIGGCVLLAVVLGFIGREPAKKAKKRPDNIGDGDDPLALSEDQPARPVAPGTETAIRESPPPPPRPGEDAVGSDRP